jgi:ABC-type Na+ efflux pump permease subunit
LIFILSLAATIRFANSVLSAVMFFSFIAIIFYSITPLGNVAKVIMPFVLMGVSVIIYFLAHNYRKKYALRHYRYCLKMLEFLSLVSTYASVNYFAVRELSNLLFDLHLPGSASIPEDGFSG